MLLNAGATHGWSSTFFWLQRPAWGTRLVRGQKTTPQCIWVDMHGPVARPRQFAPQLKKLEELGSR